MNREMTPAERGLYMDVMAYLDRRKASWPQKYRVAAELLAEAQRKMRRNHDQMESKGRV